MLKPESTSPSSNKLFKERERVLRSVLTDLTIVHPSCVNTFLVLVFTVTPSKTKIKTVTAKDRPESGKLKEVSFKCTPRLLQVSGSSPARFSERLFAQIQRPLYEEAMLVPIPMGTNTAAVNQTKKTSLSLETKM